MLNQLTWYGQPSQNVHPCHAQCKIVARLLCPTQDPRWLLYGNFGFNIQTRFRVSELEKCVITSIRSQHSGPAARQARAAALFAVCKFSAMDQHLQL